MTSSAVTIVNSRQISRPQPGDDVIVFIARRAARVPEGVEEEHDVVLFNALLKRQFSDAVAVKLEGEVFARFSRLRVVHGCVLEEEAFALDDEGQGVVAFHMVGQFSVKLIKKLLGNGVLMAESPDIFRCAIQRLQQLGDGAQFWVNSGLCGHGGRHHVLGSFEVRHYCLSYR